MEKIFPTEEELSTVSSHVRCPLAHCSAVFKSTSNLNMHMIRHHKINSEILRKKESMRQFYCPAPSCVYSKDSKKHFKKLKYLKQHYLKVHAIKNFMCHKCEKRFSTEAFKNMHARTCGTTFNCSCGHVYNSVEALLTHCKRKGHVSLSSGSDKTEKTNLNKEAVDTNENNLQKKPERFICPKLSPDISHPIHYIAAIALSELSSPCNLSRAVDKGIQTEFYKPCLWKVSSNSRTSKNNVEKKQNHSQQTQTVGRSKNLKISAQTQTNGEYQKLLLKSPKPVSSKKCRISMETQTKELFNIVLLSDNVKSCNSKILCDKSYAQDNKKDLGFYNTEMLVDHLLQDMPTTYMNDVSNSSNEIKDSCLPPTCLNNISVKESQKSDEIYNKDVNLDMSVVKQELFTNSPVLNVCSKEFETDLNELNANCKKMNNENVNPYLVDNGSYNVFDINKLCNIETQTELDSFLTDSNDDPSLTLCSTTETQTTDFDPLLYSNMCTQTCDDVDNLFNFGFVDIETQTCWSDL